MRIYAALFFILTAYSLQLTAAYADTVSSKVLIEQAKDYDGDEIAYRGEAVTAIMKRGENCWVNVHDGDNAIGIWAKSADLKDVEFLGSYNCKGDIVEIEGIFNRACPAHGGDLDIHAGKITVLEKGHCIREKIFWQRLSYSLALFPALLALIFIFRKRL